jgi:hypothetical protein
VLRDTAFEVDSVDPGFTATDLNGHCGTQTIPGSAAEAIRLALRWSTPPSFHQVRFQPVAIECSHR